MAKRLSFGGPGGSSQQGEQAGRSSDGLTKLANVMEEEAPSVNEGKLARDLRRQSLDGTIPVSLQALQVSLNTKLCPSFS